MKTEIENLLGRIRGQVDHLGGITNKAFNNAMGSNRSIQESAGRIQVSLQQSINLLKGNE